MARRKRNIDPEVGKFMKQWRKSQGLSQEELARVLRVSRATIANYENGDASPPGDLVYFLMKHKDAEVIKCPTCEGRGFTLSNK